MSEHQTTTEFRLVAFRMSADVPAMIDFLTALGLRQQTTADRQVDGRTPYATAIGRRGKVAVHLAHEAESVGRTEVTFDVDDAEAVIATLTAARIPSRRHDEAFGRVVTADTAVGDIWIGEDNADDHGYTRHDTSDVAPIDLVAVRFSTDFAAERALFATLGYAAEGPDDGEYVELSGPGGAIGLHAPSADEPSAAGQTVAGQTVGATARAAISFVTDQDLDDLAGRLMAAGYADAAVRDDGGVRALYVTDPDGQETQVFPA